MSCIAIAIWSPPWLGLTIIHIFGFDSQEALPLAESCGIAFQLTNILRDVKEDAEHGRIYLPEEDLKRFGVPAGLFKGHTRSPGFEALMHFEGARAESYYQASMPLIGLVAPESRSSLWALIEIYHRLLNRMSRSHFDVLTRRVRVPTWEKAWIVVQGRMRRNA